MISTATGHALHELVQEAILASGIACVCVSLQLYSYSHICGRYQSMYVHAHTTCTVRVHHTRELHLDDIALVLCEGLQRLHGPRIYHHHYTLTAVGDQPLQPPRRGNRQTDEE